MTNAITAVESADSSKTMAKALSGNAYHASTSKQDGQAQTTQQALNRLISALHKVAAPGQPETATQQQAREEAQQTQTRQAQQAREADEQQKARQEQQQREAQEHGVVPPAQPAQATVRVPAVQASDKVSTPATADTKQPVTGKTTAVTGVAKSSAPSAVAQSTGAGESGAPTGGFVTDAQYPLHPVPKNGGEKSETPTTIDDINGVINQIDPSLLTDPSQAGEGALNGLPYGKMFEAAGKAAGVDPALLYADAQVETGDNKDGRILVPNNINPIQTAPGVWPTTANAATNLFTGAYVMRDYIDRAGGDIARGLNAYNSGDLSPGEKGFADGYDSYYDGVMAAYGNVQKALVDPSIIGPGQGGNVSTGSQI